MKESIYLPRLLSAALGTASAFMPWLMTDVGGYVSALTLWLWFPFPVGRYSPYPYISRIDVSSVLAMSIIFMAALALMIVGCVTAFLSSVTSGMKGRWLTFSAGMLFLMAPIVFLFASLFTISVYGSDSRLFDFSLVSSGFFMAFVAAASAFASLAKLKHLVVFSAGWLTITVLVTLGLLAVMSRLAPYGALLYGTIVLGSSFYSLVAMSISTLVYGIYTLTKQKSAKPSTLGHLD